MCILVYVVPRHSTLFLNIYIYLLKIALIYVFTSGVYIEPCLSGYVEACFNNFENQMSKNLLF